jgi:fermentation-respiration switch protein FrsA (DUF1100 family)
MGSPGVPPAEWGPLEDVSCTGFPGGCSLDFVRWRGPLGGGFSGMGTQQRVPCGIRGGLQMGALWRGILKQGPLVGSHVLCPMEASPGGVLWRYSHGGVT